ncbi:MAG: hypothetical protein LBU77_01120 [Clostridiales bacterium]|jgi:hypothetical protein|nr:hypothetical protein [Clostridiales bacterium]
MKSVNGYLENGRFTPFEMVSLPKRVLAVLTYEDREESSKEDRRDAFARLVSIMETMPSVPDDTVYNPIKEERLPMPTSKS